jgi:hypothetical protein
VLEKVKPNRDLFKVVGLLAVGSGIAGTVAYNRKKEVMLMPFRLQAVDMLQNNPQAVEVIGRPVHAGSINPVDAFHNYVMNGRGRMRIPVQGSKGKGELDVWATRDTHNDMNWAINRLELELEDIKNGKFVLFDDKKYHYQKKPVNRRDGVYMENLLVD